MLLAGEVLIDEQKVDKPGRLIAANAAVRLVRQRPPFVSRAGLKLDAALHRFGVDVAGATCLDIGASTGGFTDCLLQRGAARVYAVDVGLGQLHWRIRSDERVVVREKLNARYLAADDLGEEVRFACCDVSFISCTRILPRLPHVLGPQGRAVILAKPQFEVGKGAVGKGGIVRDPSRHRAVVQNVSAALASCGFAAVEWMESPILGAGGNREFLLYGSEWSPPPGKARS